ncbi:hypothetical protein LINGRAHAP2_LOCUS7149 [Linum grandiflorum]
MSQRVLVSSNYGSNVYFMSTIHSTWKRYDNLIPMNPSFGMLDFIINLTVHTPYKRGIGLLSLGHNYDNNASGNTIPFGMFCGIKINAYGASIGGLDFSFIGYSSGQR